MAQLLRKINENPVTALMFKTFYPICEKARRKNGKLLGKKIFKSIHDGFGGSLRVLCSAGAPIKKEVADFYYAAGFNIMITYGASETNIPTIGNTPEDITTDTCGVSVPRHIAQDKRRRRNAHKISVYDGRLLPRRGGYKRGLR